MRYTGTLECIHISSYVHLEKKGYTVDITITQTSIKITTLRNKYKNHTSFEISKYTNN